MKCPSCNKFASLETQDPEFQTEDFDSESGSINVDVRLVRNSGCCNDEMKEASFQFDATVPEKIIAAHQGDGHDLEANFTAEATEEGGGRYAKSYFGVNVSVEITCSCQKQGDNPLHVEEFSEKVAASEMEELC